MEDAVKQALQLWHGLPQQHQLGVIGGAIVIAPLLAFMLWKLCSTTEKDAPPVWGGGWPIIGHFGKFAGNPVATIYEGYRANGPVFTMKFLGQPLTFLIGPDAHGPFFAGRDEELSQNEPYKFMTPIFGKGIVFDAPVDIKRQQLTFVSGALRPNALKTFIPQIVEETEAYLKDWPESGEIDLLEKLSELTILTASRCLLGKEVRSRLFGTVSRLLHDIDEGINPIAIFFPNAPLPAFWKRDKARAEFVKIFSAIIAERRAAGVQYEDMLQAFMEAEYKNNGGKLSDDQITGMLIGTLFAGQHTSSITSTWLILNLLGHKDHYERVMAEQARVLGASYTKGPAFTSEGISWDSVALMDHLHQCMKETLRQYPPLIMLMRKTHTPLPVQGGQYTVPKDHYVFAVPAVSMNLAKDDSTDSWAAGVFTKPHTFDPDRYGPGREEDKKKQHSFIAFGGGIHACLGEQFGYIQVKTIVSIILRKYEISLTGPLPKPDYTMMVVGPGAPRTVRIKRRTAAYTPKA